MKIFAASFSSAGEGLNPVKTVLVKKKKNALFLNSAQRMSVQEVMKYKKANQIKLTFDYTDFLSAEVELPPLKDPKSMSLLIRNKIQDMLSPHKEYTFVYHNASVPSADTAPSTVAEQSAITRKKYTIFGLPLDFIRKYGISQDFQARTDITTLDQFSLGYLSYIADPKGFTCHAFADNEKLLMSFSMGKDQVYARTTYKPANISSHEQLINFYYETINLTYLYIKQNKQVDINTIIFSGLLNDEKSLAASVESFASIPITYLSPGMYIKNCDSKTFHDYLLPIGCAFAEDDSNFAPIEHKENRAYKKVVKSITTVFFIGSVACGAYAFDMYTKYTDMENNFRQRLASLNSRISGLNDTISRKDELIYINDFIQLMDKKNSTPLSALKASQDLVAEEVYKMIVYDVDTNDQPMFTVEKSKDFITYTDTYAFSMEYMDDLSKLKGVRYLDKMTLKLRSKSYDMNAELILTPNDTENSK